MRCRYLLILLVLPLLTRSQATPAPPPDSVVGQPVRRWLVSASLFHPTANLAPNLRAERSVGTYSALLLDGAWLTRQFNRRIRRGNYSAASLSVGYRRYWPVILPGFYAEALVGIARRGMADVRGYRETSVRPESGAGWQLVFGTRNPYRHRRFALDLGARGYGDYVLRPVGVPRQYRFLTGVWPTLRLGVAF